LLDGHIRPRAPRVRETDLKSAYIKRKELRRTDPYMPLGAEPYRCLSSSAASITISTKTQEEEGTRILKGNTSISIVVIINVSIADPLFIYLVVIQTLLGFALVYNCNFIFNP
jgi:hypothetical protein